MKDTLPIPGLEQPFRIYFFSDTHLQACDPADSRIPSSWKDHPSPDLGMSSEALLQSHLDRAVEQEADLIIFGGDFFHFPTRENAELATRLFAENPIPVWSIPGNHDWFFPGQNGWEELRDQQLTWVQPPIEPTPWSRCWNGVRFVGIDSSTYYLAQDEIDMVRSALQGPEPVILIMHIPPSTPELRIPVIEKHGNPILVHDPEGRTREGIDPEPTRSMIRELKQAPQLKGILAAHVHLPFSGEFGPGIPLLIPEAGYRDGYRIIDLVDCSGPSENRL